MEARVYAQKYFTNILPESFMIILSKETYYHNRIPYMLIWEYILQRDDNGYRAYRELNFIPSAIHCRKYMNVYGQKNIKMHFFNKQNFLFSPKYCIYQHYMNAILTRTWVELRFCNYTNKSLKVSLFPFLRIF